MTEQAATLPSQTYGNKDEESLSEEELKFLQKDTKFDPSSIKIKLNRPKDLRNKILKSCHLYAEAFMWDEKLVGKVKHYQHCILLKNPICFREKQYLVRIQLYKESNVT